MHHGARVDLGVLVGGHGDGPQRFLLDAMLVYEPHHLEGIALGRNEDAVGADECILPGDRASGGSNTEALEL
ncbi:hypothetical protein, partial [Enterobacter hormaechei]|uniref:hypothetical protein n=1 Tax=Enterobacter hormaechei TaxID=158836 RepID=UPI0013D68954